MNLICSNMSESNILSVISFLEARGTLENDDLISAVLDSINTSCIQQVYYCYDSAVKGVMWIREVSTSSFDYTVRIDAVNYKALDTLLAYLPRNKRGYFRLHRSFIQERFRNLSGREPEHIDVLYTINMNEFHPIPSTEVRLLSTQDAYLFNYCEGWAQDVLANSSNEFSIYAIIKDNCVACSAWMGPVIPEARVKYNYIGIAGLYTEPNHRRKGYACQLVSHMTQKILNSNKIPVYWTTPDNVNSQHVVEKLGYRIYGTIQDYIWSFSG